ncbi:hypothetical protein [Thermodesulfatator atlanticus]|uniref:hypothetical protein n=1 Tax=Thermodesulfatator atlanticus TaxID=501497 RepID=UPI0003B4E3E7|nr:hypothetical protein [Thermodesulfatator atlanticus]
MLEHNLTIEEIKQIIKEVVEEVVRKEILNLRISLLPTVSDEEQKEIEESFGKSPDEDSVVYEEDVNVEI